MLTRKKKLNTHTQKKTNTHIQNHTKLPTKPLWKKNTIKMYFILITGANQLVRQKSALYQNG